MTDPMQAAHLVTGMAHLAGEIMSSPVVTVGPQTPVAEVAATLRRHAVSGVPVVEAEGGVVGLISEYDLLAKPGATAGEVMSTGVISVSPDTDLAEVRRLLIDRRIHRVPVLAAGRLVGIVSRGDVVALLATEWVCRVCGEPVRGETPPRSCPKCQAPGDRFGLQEQPPGS